MSDPFASAGLTTLDELVMALQMALDASSVTSPRKSQIAILVLTGITALASPLLFYKLWRSKKLWFFRLQRRSQGTYIVPHPLTVFAAILSVTEVLIFTCIIIKYKYEGASLTPHALPVYSSVALSTWMVPEVAPMFVVMGTICALPEPQNLGSAWYHKVRKFLGGPLLINLVTVFGPLIWIGVSTPFAVLANVHFNNAYGTAQALQRHLEQQPVESPSLNASDLQQALWGWTEFLKGFGSIRLVAILWNTSTSILIVSLLAVGSRICRILHRQLRESSKSPHTKYTPRQAAAKVRYLRESIVVLGGFYLVIALTGVILVFSMSLTANALSKGIVQESLEAFRICQLFFMWTVAIDGTFAMGLFSGRVFAAASIDAIEKKRAIHFGKGAANSDIEAANAAADDEEKLAWAKTGLKRTSGILNPGKGSRSKASPPCASMTGSGVKVDIEEEMVMDVPDLDAVSTCKSSGSSSASSTPVSLLTKLPNMSPSITSPALPSMQEETQELPQASARL
ncbi:hypothetical protein BCV69DRAFT_299657 [Microstroma glucosiphilum]|uniref:Uncharacterized protein n=1 Tax=Pseudomicrostroma glucosiphilum TaxID=1684307 RepID=A0A316U3L8_9BASI|nr:hypothetical protein BCV69DRAFT_299657 [Pseudomicrostroma glucosiphilum]PWN19896.1 hypothetical protein BCV69DRAFT_299657 [Pseudomicrostroma glucosiphilum]